MGKGQNRRVKTKGKAELSSVLDGTAKSARDTLKMTQSPEIPLCEYCGIVEDTKLCSGCQLVAYCSKEHQQLRWSAHREDCRRARKARAKNSFNIEICAGTHTGRRVRAKRDIEQGEIILEEFPLFHYSPPSELTGSPLGQCISCGEEVLNNNTHNNGDTTKRCPICNWPVCNAACAEAPIHTKYECRVLVLNAINYPEYEGTNTQHTEHAQNTQNKSRNKSGANATKAFGSYDKEDEYKYDEFEDEDAKLGNGEVRRRDQIATMILMLRGYAMWNEEKTTNWRKLIHIIPLYYQRLKEDPAFMALLSPELVEEIYSTPRGPLVMSEMYREALQKLERTFPLLPKSDQFQAKYLESMMYTKFEVIYANTVAFQTCFKTRTRRRILRTYIYQTASHFTDSCSPNCSWSIGPSPDLKIRIRAAVPIKKGTELTVYRLGVLYRGTGYRQIMMGKERIPCSCALCRDPTENGTFQSIITCQKCLQSVKNSKNSKNSRHQDGDKNGDKNDDEDGDDDENGYKIVHDQDVGFLLRFNPLAKTVKERLTMPLTIQTLELAKYVQPQAWACVKCGDVRYGSELSIHNVDLKSVMVKMASCKMDKEVRAKNTFNTLYFAGAGKYADFNTHNLQFTLAVYKCPIIPNFPQWPKKSIVAENVVQFYYLEAISRHTFLIQMLDKTHPGLQHERIHVALKLGVGLLSQFDRIFPHASNLANQNQNQEFDLFKHVEEKYWTFWLERSVACVGYLEECLLYWKGAWPSEGLEFDALLENIRQKIELAKKYQQFFTTNANICTVAQLVKYETVDQLVQHVFENEGDSWHLQLLKTTSCFMKLAEKFSNVIGSKSKFVERIMNDNNNNNNCDADQNDDDGLSSISQSSKENPGSNKQLGNFLKETRGEKLRTNNWKRSWAKKGPASQKDESILTKQKTVPNPVASYEQVLETAMAFTRLTKRVEDGTAVKTGSIYAKPGSKEAEEVTEDISEFLHNFMTQFPQKRELIKNAVMTKNYDDATTLKVMKLLGFEDSGTNTTEDSIAIEKISLPSPDNNNYQTAQLIQNSTEYLKLAPIEITQSQTLNPNPIQKSQTKPKTNVKISTPKSQSSAGPKSTKNIPKENISKLLTVEFTENFQKEKPKGSGSKCAQELQLRHWNFYVSKLPVQAEASHLIAYLQNHGMDNVSAEKLPPKQGHHHYHQEQRTNPVEKYASFHIQFDASHNIKGDDPRFWPAGSIVRPWSLFESMQEFL